MDRASVDKAAPGILIAGTASGVGKTTLATGIMGALRRRGLVVQPFKVGPDYIDPSYHSTVCGRPSRNLDNWMVPASSLRELYARATASVDIAVVEGVMGLFDGRSGRDGAGGSAEVAKLLGLPVLLVMDVSKMARSAGAMALGYARFDPNVKVAGIIANDVGSTEHLRMVAEAVEDATDLPVVGHLPRRDDLRLPERHLGLIPTAEGRTERDFFLRLVEQIEETVDLDAVLRVAREAAPVDAAPTGIFPEVPTQPVTSIGVARDEAFCFYYEDNLDLLSAWGARLIPFSPLHDRALPEGIQGLYLGGGFPELFAEALADNGSMMASIRAAHAAGMPIYAECGGLMYLCQSIENPERRRCPMVGLVPARALMPGGRIALGYRQVRARRSTILLEEGQMARGHEFHWSGVEPVLDGPEAPYEVLEEGGMESAGVGEGYQQGNLLASYIHLHFASHPRLAASFVASCSRYGSDASPWQGVGSKDADATGGIPT